MNDSNTNDNMEKYIRVQDNYIHHSLSSKWHGIVYEIDEIEQMAVALCAMNATRTPSTKAEM